MELQQQRQADTRFRGGEGDGEDIHYLAIGLAPVAPCNHESQRRGIDQVPARVSAVPGDRFLKVEFIPAEEGRK